ncbi:methyltransferase domain-containing protein [Streptomyces sp. NPDC002055]|uniref:methyltransferase domain-containing protein n=1 Tax=Streptomyces sp. NPDC002055 TaxID=3154534 RepID=UPI00332D1D74
MSTTDTTTPHTPQDAAGAAPHTADGLDDDTTRYAPEWLQLREPADAAARAEALLGPLRDHLASGRRDAEDGAQVVRDLGCGTGSMGRWLAPRLPGAQHWILHDHDPELLARAAASAPSGAADGSPVTVATACGPIAGLTAEALAGTALVTASALLDVLTPEELHRLVAACTGAGCPALLALSVVGRVEITPADPLDAEIADAFNAHQRREELLGSDAVAAATDAFEAAGATVRVATSAWRLGPDASALAAEWLRGWVAAACEQRPELTDRAEEYLRRRLAACAAGELRVVVHHSDLLALPPAAA